MFAALLVNAAFGEKEYTRIYSTMQFFSTSAPSFAKSAHWRDLRHDGRVHDGVHLRRSIFICLIVGFGAVRGSKKAAAVTEASGAEEP